MSLTTAPIGSDSSVALGTLAPGRLQIFWDFGGPTGILVVARLAGSVIMIGVQLALAQLAGAEQLGMFFLAASLSTIAAVIAAGGYPNIVIKIVSRDRIGGPRSAALSRIAAIDIGVAALCIGGLVVVGSTLATHGTAVLFAAAAIPILAWGRLLSAFAIAHKRPLLGNLPDLLGRPLIMGIGFAAFWLAGFSIDAVVAASLFVVSVAVPVGLLTLTMIRSGTFPSLAKPADFRLRRLLRAIAFPLVAVSALSTLIGDVAIVASGLFLSAAELGIFALALKIALLIGFSIQIIHQISSPKIALEHRLGRAKGVRAEVNRTNRCAIAATLLATLLISSFAPPILSWLGEGFSGGVIVLMVLIAGQLARAYLGPSMQALVLVSANQTSSMLSIAAALILVAGIALLAPRYGELGAAVAMSATMLVWFGSAAVVAARNGLNTAGLGFWKASNVISLGGRLGRGP